MENIHSFFQEIISTYVKNEFPDDSQTTSLEDIKAQIKSFTFEEQEFLLELLTDELGETMAIENGYIFLNENNHSTIHILIKVLAKNIVEDFFAYINHVITIYSKDLSLIESTIEGRISKLRINSLDVITYVQIVPPSDLSYFISKTIQKHMNMLEELLALEVDSKLDVN